MMTSSSNGTTTPAERIDPADRRPRRKKETNNQEVLALWSEGPTHRPSSNSRRGIDTDTPRRGGDPSEDHHETVRATRDHTHSQSSFDGGGALGSETAASPADTTSEPPTTSQEDCATKSLCSVDSGILSQTTWRAAPRKWYVSGNATANLASGAAGDAATVAATAPTSPPASAT